MNVHDFKVRAVSGELVSLSKYHGKTLLIVNIATKCGPNAAARRFRKATSNL